MSGEYLKLTEEYEKLAKEIFSYNPSEDINKSKLKKIKEELIIHFGDDIDKIRGWLLVYGFCDNLSNNTNKKFSFLEEFFNHEDEQLFLFS